jgi:hypothetical protein
LRFMAEITSVKSLIFKSKTTKSHQQQNMLIIKIYDNPYTAAF